MRNLSSVFLMIAITQVGFGQLVINELDCDTPGVDNKEFIEIKSNSPDFPLDGYVIVFFNGSTNGDDRSYMTIDLDGYTTDVNGLLLIASSSVTPFPQLLIPENVIQNGADAIGIYLGSDFDFPEGTLATTTNLIDALAYDTSDADDVVLMGLLGLTEQINEGSGNNTNSIQRNNDGTYFTGTPTPRQLNDGSGVLYNAISMSTETNIYDEGQSFNITFTAEQNVTSDLMFDISLNNGTFNTSDFTGNTSLTIPNGQNSVMTTISTVDDALDEGDEELIIRFTNLQTPYIPFNSDLLVRIVDNDFTVATWGTPISPTFGVVSSTQPDGYYDSLDGLSGAALEQEIQDIIADPVTVRAQTYADVIDILKEADENPAHSNQVWLVYTEQGRPKLDLQTGSNNNGKWNREHTFPRSRGGFFDIEEDEIADGINVWWTTEADSLRHGNSDAHALRAADGPENSLRGNQHYGQYTGPAGNQGSFKGDVARSVLYMQIRYNGLSIENGFPEVQGQLGDLVTLLDWHRNDPPDDFEMNRNNIIYNWQMNRNPFIDQPDMVEYIWGIHIGEVWNQPLNVEESVAQPVRIYPIPARDHIQIRGLKEPSEIIVISSDGRTLFSKEMITDGRLDLSLSAGLYFLHIKNTNQSSTHKFIIK
ncbi:MAG: T9SS type A sorting domain-containing protein [Flavobacteriaceae bacterium]|nr:T9SS type A sorting domain-containing protein [Flavobacteriaceae bacterium]